MHRFYISPQSIVDNTVVISQPEYHHIVSVLRSKKDDIIKLFDGKGNEYNGRIEFIDRKAKSVRVFVEQVYKEEPTRSLVLVQSLIKSSNMDLIIQKATELGVTHIYPLITTNSVIKLEPRSQYTKINKWRRITEEACKQCGRSWLPFIDKVWSFNEVVDSLNRVEAKIICTPLAKSGSLKEISSGNPGSAAVMIGPEGDFTQTELNLAVSRGWSPVQIGRNILRAETAAIAMLGVVSYKFGYWG